MVDARLSWGYRPTERVTSDLWYTKMNICSLSFSQWTAGSNNTTTIGTREMKRNGMNDGIAETLINNNFCLFIIMRSNADRCIECPVRLCIHICACIRARACANCMRIFRELQFLMTCCRSNSIQSSDVHKWQTQIYAAFCGRSHITDQRMYEYVCKNVLNWTELSWLSQATQIIWALWASFDYYILLGGRDVQNWKRVWKLSVEHLTE